MRDQLAIAPGQVAALHPDGRLTEAAIIVLHAVSGVDLALLRTVRIRPSRKNWLRAPWYRYRRGGALTVGRTIWFTGIWFSPQGYGDGSPTSTLRWMLHLAHEVGHLPQAERFGRSLPGKLRYVAAFTWQYGTRAILLRRPIHDGSLLEREADVGRKVLQDLIAARGDAHPLILAVHGHLPDVARNWCAQQAPLLADLAATRRAESLA